MSQFSSGKHEKLSGDPWPYVWKEHSPRNQMRADTDMFRAGAPRNWSDYTYRPRPEFDHPLTNRANPVLVTFRNTRSEFWNSAYWFAVALVSEGGVSGYARLEAKHAASVLIRLARIDTPELYEADPAGIITKDES